MANIHSASEPTRVDPYPPETVEQAHRFLRENPSIDAINLAMEDRFRAAPDPMNDRVFEVLRDGLNPFNGRGSNTVRVPRKT